MICKKYYAKFYKIMATAITYNSLSKAHKALIRSELIIKPVESGYNARSRFRKGKDPIKFYRIDDLNNMVYLPISFGSIILEEACNAKIETHERVKFEHNITLRDYQIPIFGKAIELVKKFNGVHLAMCTGSGKTSTATAISSVLKRQTLVLVRDSGLALQWCYTYAKKTNVKRIWMIKSKLKKHQKSQIVIKAEKLPELDENVDVIIWMAQSFHKLPQKYKESVGTVIVDESDEFCVKTMVDCLLGTTPRYFISLSATLKRPDGMHKMIEYIVGEENKIVYRYKNPFTVHYVRTMIVPEIKKQASGDTDFTELEKTLASNEERNQIILDIVSHLPDRKILICTKLYDHALLLRDMLLELGEDVDLYAGQKNKYFDSRILCATYKKAGRGFDEESFCDDFNGIRLDSLILGTPFKSHTQLEQLCGRVFRAHVPEIYDLVDECSITKRQFGERKKWYLDPEMKGSMDKITIKKGEPFPITVNPLIKTYTEKVTDMNNVVEKVKDINVKEDINNIVTEVKEEVNNIEEVTEDIVKEEDITILKKSIEDSKGSRKGLKVPELKQIGKKYKLKKMPKRKDDLIDFLLTELDKL